MNGDTLIERTFDSQNRETTRTAGSNTQSQLHDRYGCLIKRKWQGQQSATRRYRWDAENRLEATEDSLTGSTHYQRDSQGQLTQENDTEYHYDLGGNRVPEGGQLQQDRLLTTATDKRDYDALGAEVRITGQTTEHRTFDAEGQLIELKRPSLHITYGYDALGRRAWRKTDAGTTTYLWHNDVLLGEQSPKGDWQWYLRDPQTDEPLITLIDNQPYYYELDHRMMPLRLWDQSGQKVWEGPADAWGKCQPEILEGSIHQPLRLPGQFEDELTGIVQNRFRDYDPATGRYLAPDPYGIKGGLNGYRYTPNPVDYVDPLGLEFKSVVTTKNAPKGPEAAIDDTPAMSEVPEGESIGLKKNADGDLILCVGEEACADPSNVEDAGWGDVAIAAATVALSRVPFMKGAGSNLMKRKKPDTGSARPDPKRSKPTTGPGSDAHRTERWEEYKARNGKWSKERWDKQYDVNMQQAKKSHEAVAKHREKNGLTKEKGWEAEKTIKDSKGNERRLDIVNKKKEKAIEHKKGDQYLSKSNLSEIERDAALRENTDWDIRWHFDDHASKPLLNKLDELGIPWTKGKG